MGIASELTTIKEDISDGVIANKVSRFAYTQQAYTDNNVDGVLVYDVNQEQNIPVGTPSVMKVNETVVDKGWRARASSITRMLMNHFLGRVSYNLNKANDMINSILVKLVAYLGTADGIATLDSNALVPSTQLPKSNIAQDTDTKMFTAKGAFDYTLGSVTGRRWLGKVFGHLFGRFWNLGTGTTQDFRSVYYANGLWVAGSYNYGLWWSEDGKAWTQGTGAMTSYYFHSVYYANGLWVAGSYTHGLWWSEDGKAWTQVTGTTTSYTFRAVYYANGLWVAGSNGFWWSEDGKAWTQGTGASVTMALCIVYAKNIFLVGTLEGGGVRWSSDGKDWAIGSGLTYEVRSIAYGNNMFVACADDDDSGGGIWWSTNGKAWTQGTGSMASRTFYSIHYANGLWVAGHSQGLCWSEDGKAWTQGTGVPTDSFVTVYYANGLWVAGSDDAEDYGLWWSEDGKNWNRATGTMASYDYNVVYYANGMWLAGASAQGLWWSSIEQLVEQGYFVD